MKWRITLLDTTTGDVYSETIDHYGVPNTIVDPYYGAMSGRTGHVLRIERVLIPDNVNMFE